VAIFICITLNALCPGDAHVYKTHISPLQTQLSREPKPFPKVRFKRSLDELLADGMKADGSPATNGASALDDNAQYVHALEAIKESDFVVEGYESWPTIKMEMSV
jgi:thymidylate synthase